MPDDIVLLRRFAYERDDEAFSGVVRRNIDFVYRTALRQVNGDAHLAQDVTQAVFLQLARKAAIVADHRVLAGWLHHATRFCARAAIRSERRWQKREQEAQTMIDESRQSPSAADWARIHPVLDEALQEIGSIDREALLMRYYEDRPYAELGGRLGLAESAARMRVDRALDKLRLRLARRGIKSTAAALGAVMASQPVFSAPAALETTVIQSSIAGVTAAAGAGVASTLFTMSTTKAVVVTAGLVALIATGYYAGLNRATVSVSADNEARVRDMQNQITRLQRENRAQRAEAVQLQAPNEPAEAVAPETAVAAVVPYSPGVPPRLEVSALAPAGGAAQVLNNLRQLSAASDQFQLENRRVPTFDDLVGPQKYIKALNAADSEIYANLDFSRGAALSVTTASGEVVTYGSGQGVQSTQVKSPMQQATEGALAAFRQANEGRSPVGYELAEYFDNTAIRESYVDSTRVKSLQRTVDAGLVPTLEKAGDAYDKAYRAAYGTSSPKTFAAFESMASFIENDADRARYVEALRSVSAESQR